MGNLEDMEVEKAELSEGMAEVMNIMILMKESKKRDIVVSFVPPKTRAWSEMNQQKMLDDTVGQLE